MSENYNQGAEEGAIKVHLMFGLKGIDKDGLDQWDPNELGKLEYDNDFDLSTTANQNRLKQICVDLRTKNEIVLDGKVECWIEDFETWLTAGNGTGSFPSASLNSDLDLFVKSNDGAPYFYKNYIGLIDGKLKFTMIRALSQGISRAPHKDLNPIYEKWIDEIDSINKASSTGLN